MIEALQIVGAIATLFLFAGLLTGLTYIAVRLRAILRIVEKAANKYLAEEPRKR